MEMTSLAATMLANDRVRPLKRVEYDRLAAEGFFDAEKVELLFGVVVEMAPVDPSHAEMTDDVRRVLERMLGHLARVMSQRPFAALDSSEPEPDVFVVPNSDYRRQHPDRACLVVEVARSSLDQDRGAKAMLYAMSAVEEYWIVNLVDNVLEVYRDRAGGAWRTRTTHGRGDVVTPTAFPGVEVAVTELLPPLTT